MYPIHLQFSSSLARLATVVFANDANHGSSVIKRNI